jgi:hypothetical chaperone protein
MSTPITLGIDFGTTNTVVAQGDGSGGARLVAFETPAAPATTFRSALSFNHDPEKPTGRVVNAGPWAIEAYLDDPAETRFIQSFKSYAASPAFSETQILGRRYAFEDMLSAFLLRLRAGRRRWSGDRRAARPVRGRRGRRGPGAQTLSGRVRPAGIHRYPLRL